MAADTKKTGKSAYQPTRFMLPTSHYDRRRADRAASFMRMAFDSLLYPYRDPEKMF